MEIDSSNAQSPILTRSPYLHQKFYGPNNIKPPLRFGSMPIFKVNPFFSSNIPIDNGSMPQVHLLQTDLWEAITGERLSPQNICQICEMAIPGYRSTGYIPINSTQITTSIPPTEIPAPYDLNKNYVKMAKDRKGSLNIQQEIQCCTTAERRQIFAAIIPSLSELVYDQSSNYVIQKLCEYLDYSENKSENDTRQSDYSDFDVQFLTFFLSDIKNVIDHSNSCRVLQKFLEHTTNLDYVDQIYKSVREYINSMCTSPNGNHIVQRFIELLPDRITEIVEIIHPYVSTHVIHSCGCRVVQKLFDCYDISLLRPLVDEVLTCAADLAENQYGNYVVQNILDSGPDSDIAALINEFKGGFYNFSIHKFASNVIEKCIRRANADQREEIFEEIIRPEGKYQEQRILKMVTDQFGNYVMQRIIEFGSESQRTAIYNVVYDNYFEAMQKNYSRHVITRLQDLGYEF